MRYSDIYIACMLRSHLQEDMQQWQHLHIQIFQDQLLQATPADKQGKIIYYSAIVINCQFRECIQIPRFS